MNQNIWGDFQFCISVPLKQHNSNTNRSPIFGLFIRWRQIKDFTLPLNGSNYLPLNKNIDRLLGFPKNIKFCKVVIVVAA